MKQAVLIAAILFGVGAVQAAPVPVEDIAAQASSDDGGQQLARLERIIRARQMADAQMQQRVSELQQEVLDLRGDNERLSYQVKQILQRQRQLYTDVGNLSSSPSANKDTGNSDNQASQSGIQNASTGGISNTAASTADTATRLANMSETASYENAVNLVLKQRKYNEAIPAFEQFIVQYPSSSYAANANYWLGQLLYNDNKLAESKQAFTKVVTQFKESAKRGDSLVKLGLIAEQDKDTPAARNFYQQVVKEYSGSAAARIAQQKLAALSTN